LNKEKNMTTSPEITLQDCQRQLSAAEMAVWQKDLNAAFTHLNIAHRVCHANKKLHVKVHRALVHLGWLKRSPALFFTHICLLSLAWLFD
jgi:hypothetical protein